jgi:enoyl-CoA hydratase/carnithine racemase
MLNLNYIKYEVHKDGTAFVNISRNHVNSINIKLLEDLDIVVNDISGNSNCKVVIFRSSQKHFCAGADLKERKDMNEKETFDFLSKINNVFDSISNLPCPTICSINGAALGGGLELALSCDFRIASDTACVGLTETSLGVIPGASGIYRLFHLIGSSKSKYWVFTAQKFSAAVAHEDGVIDIITSEEELLGTTLEVAQEILDNAPLAIKYSNQIFKSLRVNKSAFDKEQKEAYKKVINTKDKSEAITAFFEKRKPKWKNE